MSLLKSLSVDDFLQNYWEKKHLFLPQTFSKPKLSLDFDEILNLGLEDEIESRLILQNLNGADSWNVLFGPLEDLSFREKKTPWTLFLHNFNLFEQFSFELQKMVNFIPSSLFDDVLCSISSDGSSVGAHFDRYNVFIIQIYGQREWKIQEEPTREFRENSEIKILKSFTPDLEYILSPGDMIFIPPGCAHGGTSIGDSISLSIGFKSLEDGALLESFFSEVLSKIDAELFFKTNTTHFSNSHFEIKEGLLNDLHTRLKKEFSDPETFQNAMMKYFTSPKSEQFIENSPLTFDSFSQKLENEKFFFRNEVRFAKFANKFWVNEISFILSSSQEKELINLIEKRFESESIKASESLIPILYELYENEIIYDDSL